MKTAPWQHPSCLSMCRNLVAVHSRKADVEEDNLGPVSARDLDGVRAVMGGLHVVAEERQEPRQSLGHVDVVVDNEDAGRGAGRRRRSLWPAF